MQLLAAPVAPLAGAWIEICVTFKEVEKWQVAPLAGAWIEIGNSHSAAAMARSVAPLAGAWIEMIDCQKDTNSLSPSLPLRERGLK